jgi:anthranilate phosphoribosyltransferase
VLQGVILSATIDFIPLLRRVVGGENLTQDEAVWFVGEVMDANYTPSQAAALLVALAAKGESVDEIVGAARAMRERSLKVEHNLPMVVDVVGTGGDHANTINISTMAALVVASAGIPVAKHGNRAASSACGSADVLEAAGFNHEIEPDRASRMLREIGFTFLFAPRYHPAMRNVASVRRELGVRTIFNLLGPLTNPAGATHLVVGVARESLVEPIGEALRRLGARRGAVVYGCSGVDEVVGDAPTLVYQFDEEGARVTRLEPSAFGIGLALRTPIGGSVEESCEAFMDILAGVRSSASDVVALNAAVVFHAIGAEPKLPVAFERARALLESGAVWPAFERAREMSHDG